MPQLAPVILKDDLDANHTFNPKGIVVNVATLAESSGVPIGNNTIQIRHDSGKGPLGREKVKISFQLPVVQNVEVSGVTRPTVVRVAYGDITFSFDKGSGTAERANTIAFAKNSLANAMILAVAKDLDDLY